MSMACCDFQISENHQCGSYAFNLWQEGIEQKYCDRHHWQDEADRLRAEVEALRADAATDRKLVQAAEKFIHPVLQELQFERGHGSLAVHNLRLVLIEAMKANAKHAEIDAARAAQGDKT